MKIEIEFGSSFCYISSGTINSVEIKENDFGSHSDIAPEEAEPYGCGNMQFERIPSTQQVLDKYSITEEEYQQVCDKLQKGLSFGCCGWCV